MISSFPRSSASSWSPYHINNSACKAFTAQLFLPCKLGSKSCSGLQRGHRTSVNHNTLQRRVLLLVMNQEHSGSGGRMSMPSRRAAAEVNKRRQEIQRDYQLTHGGDSSSSSTSSPSGSPPPARRMVKRGSRGLSARGVSLRGLRTQQHKHQGAPQGAAPAGRPVTAPAKQNGGPAGSGDSTRARRRTSPGQMPRRPDGEKMSGEVEKKKKRIVGQSGGGTEPSRAQAVVVKQPQAQPTAKTTTASPRTSVSEKAGADMNGAGMNGAVRSGDVTSPNVETSRPPVPKGQDPSSGSGSVRGEEEPVQKLRLSGVLVVEGLSDKQAVLRAVSGEVVVLGGGNSVVNKDFQCSPRVISLIRKARANASEGPITVLTDPDQVGRQIRVALNRQYQHDDIRHAFISSRDATAKQSTKHHEAGNLGVEHASSAAIQAALKSARPLSSSSSSSSSGVLFERGDLEEWRLAEVFGEHGPPVRFPHFSTSLRRRKVGEFLGFGDAPAKAFLKSINSYGFSRVEIQHAIECVAEEERALLLEHGIEHGDGK